MARSDELLISRSRTLRSLRAFAASSFMCSRGVFPPTARTGLSGSDGTSDAGPTADSFSDAKLSGSDMLLYTRFSVCSGLGVTVGGLWGACGFLSGVTESIDDRLALLPCPNALDRLFDNCDTASESCDCVETPETLLILDGRVRSVGRTTWGTWGAPFRGVLVIFSLVGEGDRPVSAFCAELPPAHGSSNVDADGDGLSTGELTRGSASESAWKNLFSIGDLPSADSGGEGSSELGVRRSCCPLA